MRKFKSNSNIMYSPVKDTIKLFRILMIKDYTFTPIDGLKC